MSSDLIFALLSFFGSCVGTLGGILAANKLTNYRIAQLERRVEQHNRVVERTFRLEGAVEEIRHEMKGFYEREFREFRE